MDYIFFFFQSNLKEISILSSQDPINDIDTTFIAQDPINDSDTTFIAASSVCFFQINYQLRACLKLRLKDLKIFLTLKKHV
jgi:hypothetical protein